MDRDKSLSQGGAFPPQSGQYSLFSPSGNNGSNINVEPPVSSLPPFGPGPGATSEMGRFSHDISRMPDNPPKNLGHRRAHSEILTLPDDLSFDSDLGVVGGFDVPSYSDDTEEDLFSMYLDMDKFNTSCATSNFQVGEPSSAVAAVLSSSGASPSGENIFDGNERPNRVRHQHSQSMDGLTTIKPEMLMSGSDDGLAGDSKKAMSAAKLAELALVDPKRAKRIWANRQSAARSKERKMRYIAELERKVQTLQTEATSLSAQLSLLQRDTNGLNAEHSELKLRLQTMEQQVHLQDALNDALKEEVQHLKALTGQMSNNGPMMNYPSYGGGGKQYFSNSNNQAMHTLLAAQQFKQLHIQQQQQQHQLQQHQLHQFQQHQQQRQQQHQQQQQQSGEMIRGLMSSSGMNENSLDTNPSASKD